MVQCSDNNTDQPVTTLKSLKDPNCLLDNISMRSHRLVVKIHTNARIYEIFVKRLLIIRIYFSSSPNNSYYQTDSASNTYLRPKPPPYKGGTLNRNGVDI